MGEIWSKMYIGLHVKYLLVLSDFNGTWIFSADFRRILKNKISRKSVHWEPSCSTRTDGRTDRHDKAISRFSQFCTRAEKFHSNWEGLLYNLPWFPRVILRGPTHNNGCVHWGGGMLDAPVLDDTDMCIISSSTGIASFPLNFQCAFPTNF